MLPQFLKGIRFADFTWAGAGTFATKIFSDFGADVVKIESHGRPDNTRIAGPFKDGVAGLNRSGYFSSRNTGKKSFTANLKTPEGMAVVRDIIAQSDVVSNNFAAGAMDRLGLSYDDVRKIKGDIVYLAMPMYGSAGPLAKMPGLGMTISAVTGLTGLTGYHEGPPVGPGTHFPDHAANPYHAAFAVMAALRLRDKNGTGMEIDFSQVESMLNCVGLPFLEYQVTGIEPQRVGNRSRFHAPHNMFACKGDDRWCAIAVLDDSQWQALCRTIGRADLAADTTLAAAGGRLAAVDRIEVAVGEWTATREPRDVMETLQAAGVPAGMVSDCRDLMDDDPQLRHRGFWQSIAHPEMGATREHSPPYLIDDERVTLRRAPLIGEHTDEVLTSVLGYSPERIAELRGTGVLD